MGRSRPIRGGLVAALLLLAVGCRPEPPPELPGDDDAGDDDAVQGTFGLIHLHDDGEHVALHGAFARDLPSLGVVDPLAPMGLVDPSFGYWTHPPEPEEQLAPIDELVPDWQWTEDQFYDAGETLSVAGVTAQRITEWDDPDGFLVDEPIVYLGAADTSVFETDEPWTVSWPGGEDIEPFTHTGGNGSDTWIELLSPAPGESVRWVEGTDLALEWASVGGGEIRVTVMGDERWYQAVLPGDAEQVSLPAFKLADAIRERAEISVALVGVGSRPVGEGWVEIWRTRSRSFVAEYSGVLVAEPTDLFLAGTHAVTVTHLDGAFVQGDTTFDLGDGITVDSVVVPGGTGPEAQLQVTVAADAATGPRDLTATTGGTPVPSERALRVLLPRAESCATAFALPDEGSFHGDLSGMLDDHGDPSACTGYPAPGPDAVFSIVVPEYAIIAVTLWIPGADAVVYLFHDCADASAPDACSDSGGLNVPEEMSFAPLPGHAGTYHIAVDAFDALPEGTGAYTLDVELIGY